MLPSEVELRKLLTVLRPDGKVKVKGFLKKSAVEFFFFSDHWSFNKNITHTHTCSPEISFAAKRLSMGIHSICFSFEEMYVITWVDASSVNSSEKRTCFGIPLIQKKVSKQKKENDITLEWFYHYNILQQWILTILQPFSPTAKALPTLRAQIFGGFISGVENRRNYSQRGSTWLHRFPGFENRKSLRSGAGSFGRRRSGLKRELNLTKANQPNGIHFVITKNDTFCYTSSLFNAFLGIFTCWIMLN